MTRIFQGGEACDFFPSDANVFESTLAVAYDSTWSRCALGLSPTNGNVSSFAVTPLWTQQTTLWFHGVHYQVQKPPSTFDAIMFYNASGVCVFKVRFGDGGSSSAQNTRVTCQYWNGSSYVTTGATFVFSCGVKTTFDVKVVLGASGSFELYQSGSLRDSGAISSASADNCNRLLLINNYISTYWSQVMVDTTSTVGQFLKTVPPTGDSATNTGGTNGYDVVDEIVYTDADFWYSTAANDVRTYTNTGLSLTGYDVIAWSVSARARRGAGGPQNLQLALRTSATNYFSASKPQDLGYAPYQNIWETNPNTSAAWVNTVIPEFGQKSIT